MPALGGDHETVRTALRSSYRRFSSV